MRKIFLLVFDESSRERATQIKDIIWNSIYVDTPAFKETFNQALKPENKNPIVLLIFEPAIGARGRVVLKEIYYLPEYPGYEPIAKSPKCKNYGEPVLVDIRKFVITDQKNSLLFDDFIYGRKICARVTFGNPNFSSPLPLP